MKISVLTSVYKNDNAEAFREALLSITSRQTIVPDEVILVVDGPVNDAIKSVIVELTSLMQYIKPIFLEKNVGLGEALRIGAEQCSHELIARMDSDDIALPDRFEKQLAFMEDHAEIAVSGGQISEFIDNPSNIVGYRTVPLTSKECKKYYRDRDPLNHMTVMIRKDALMNAGNYRTWHLDEDTYLWGRILKNGYKIANLPDVLVNVRVGDSMYERRGGWKYFKSDSKILKWKLQNGLTPYNRYLYNYIVRFVVQVAIPNKVRGFIFKNLLRSKKTY